ncbi:MAG: tetratricopeptide repeat protein [Smithella sp.]|jgi:tetratricopeptide (TPR) repeat protein
MKNNSFEKKRADFLSKAQEFLQEGNLSDALNLAGERLQDIPADADALGVYCEAMIGMGRLDEMRAALKETEEIIAGLNLVYERAGDACREKGFHQEAAVWYEKFISLRPEARKAGEIIEKMTLLNQEDSVSEEVNIPGNENITEQEFFTVTLARLYIKQGHLQDAEVILEEIINKEPDNTQALAMLKELRGSQDFPSAENEKNIKNDNLIKTLSSWLKNIERLKRNAAEE